MSSADSIVWPLYRRIAFRFAFCYWALYLSEVAPVGILPWGSDRAEAVLEWPLHHLSVWVGVHLFHLTGIAATWHPTGSGDTALSWVLVPCMLVLAVIASAIWSVLDRRRLHYRTLAPWLRLVLAYTLALTMLSYGFFKVFPSQFRPPTLAALTETYGDSTPMRLLWTFMGASFGYTVMAGLGEVTGGFLLLFRRTRTVGAIVASAILFNIFLLNMFYDVPVKLYSFHLLLVCAWIVAPNVPALFRLLFLGAHVQLHADVVARPSRRPLRIAAWAIKAAILVCALWTLGWQNGWRGRYIPPVRGPLFGVWTVDRATSTAPQRPWKRIIVTSGNGFVLTLSDGSNQTLQGRQDTAAKTFYTNSKATGDGVLHYTLTGTPKATGMVLDGQFNKGNIHVELTRTSPDSFLLETQGFHWVHETAPNR